jgi:3D (Asp-Asp-Asp) domain-containing protein
MREQLVDINNQRSKIEYDNILLEGEIDRMRKQSEATKTVELSRGGSIAVPPKPQMELMGNMKITAYNKDECDKSPRDKSYGISASMKPVEEWHTIAMDKSIPFGTKVYIPYFADKPNGGIFVVEDRGGAIRGNSIDIYLDEPQSGIREFGVKHLDVYRVND